MEDEKPEAEPFAREDNLRVISLVEVSKYRGDRAFTPEEAVAAAEKFFAFLKG